MRIGRLRPGLAADALVNDGNPLDDLDALRDPLLILQGGRTQAVAGRESLSDAARARPL